MSDMRGISVENPVKITQTTIARDHTVFLYLTHGVIDISEYGDEIMVAIRVTDGATIRSIAPGTIFIESPSTALESEASSDHD